MGGVEGWVGMGWDGNVLYAWLLLIHRYPSVFLFSSAFCFVI